MLFQRAYVKGLYTNDICLLNKKLKKAQYHWTTYSTNNLFNTIFFLLLQKPRSIMGHGNDTVIHVDLPYSEKILESVALILVLVASSFLNITTCAIIARNKLLRTRPANVFVANLCLSNMVLTWFVIPFSLATLLWNKHDAYSGPACTVSKVFYSKRRYLAIEMCFYLHS